MAAVAHVSRGSKKSRSGIPADRVARLEFSTPKRLLVHRQRQLVAQVSAISFAHKSSIDLTASTFCTTAATPPPTTPFTCKDDGNYPAGDCLRIYYTCIGGIQYNEVSTDRHQTKTMKEVDACLCLRLVQEIPCSMRGNAYPRKTILCVVSVYPKR